MNFEQRMAAINQQTDRRLEALSQRLRAPHDASGNAATLKTIQKNLDAAKKLLDGIGRM